MGTINFRALMKAKELWDLKKLIIIKQDNIISPMEINHFKIMKKVKKNFLKTIKKFKKHKNKIKIYKKTKINLLKMGYSPLNNKKIVQKKKSIIQRIKVKNSFQTLKIK
jgi:flagellar motor component MotA